MPVPTYDQFIEPVLRFLAQHPEGAPAREAHEAAADGLRLTPEQRAEVLPSGRQPIYKNRAGWAHDRLKRAGLSTAPRRGFWVLTDAGRAFDMQHRGALSAEEVEDLAAVARDSRLGSVGEDDTNEVVPLAPTTAATESPDDRLETALSELHETVAAELLESLASCSPKFFEFVVLDVLHAIGYGASRSDLRRVGGSGDGGIDGIISLDRLGLEKVYVQAKRWQNVVGRPDVQGFYGALAGQRASKGVFITTSTFSAQAVEFANSVERIVLVDGVRLANLMIEHKVGVSHRVVKVAKLDSDYFEE
jgi:restriction system protein